MVHVENIQKISFKSRSHDIRLKSGDHFICLIPGKHRACERVKKGILKCPSAVDRVIIEIYAESFLDRAVSRVNGVVDHISVLFGIELI